MWSITVSVLSHLSFLLQNIVRDCSRLSQAELWSIGGNLMVLLDHEARFGLVGGD